MNRQRMFFLVLGVIMISTLGSCSAGHNGPKSDHFDGRRFFGNESHHSFGDMVKWLWEMETVEWPEWIDDPKQPPPPDRLSGDSLRITYINHATVLIQSGKLNILTDPIWSKTAGPFSWLGVNRIRNPGVSFENLPKIDIVLISHDHYDHLDLPTLKKLHERDSPLVVTGLGLTKYLKGHDIKNVVELDWWQDHSFSGSQTRITFVPAMHDSGRWPFMSNKTLWGGFVISNTNKHIYFAGDTGYGSFLNEIEKRFNSFDLTILPIGSYEKRWFMKNSHMNPDDAVKAHLLLNSQQSVGIHFGTFSEHPEQTVDAHERDLEAALKDHNLNPEQFWVLKFGEGKTINP